MEEDMNKFEDEVLYGISINGMKPSTWSKEYPSKNEMNFNSAPQFESIEIIEKDVTYENVAKIK